jgi:hypothetical protein
LEAKCLPGLERSCRDARIAKGIEEGREQDKNGRTTEGSRLQKCDSIWTKHTRC